MPGVERLSVDLAVTAAKEAASLGIPAMALFPNTHAERKNEKGREAYNPDNLICRAVAPSNARCPEIGVIVRCGAGSIYQPRP